ncbi:MAG: hypothetical protein ACTSRG_16975 [Candidatus Helarchaeota archaeon]
MGEEDLPSEEELKKQIDEAMKIAEEKRKKQASKAKPLDKTEFENLEKHIDEKAKKV